MMFKQSKKQKIYDERDTSSYYDCMPERYVCLTKKMLGDGLTIDEGNERGYLYRKLSFQVRQNLFKKNHFFEEGVIYKHVVENGLHKMVIDKKSTAYQNRKSRNEN